MPYGPTAAKIDRPVFVIGCGRSGTTLLFKLLSRHPDLAWFSNYSDWYPDRPWLAALGRLWDLPYLGPKIAGRIPGLLFSHESINLYLHCGIHSLIWEKGASLTEADLTPQAAECFRTLVAKHLAYRGKTRFANKDTNNCMRIRYLKAIFPDALFIHILRDGRAVSSSLKHVDWWPDLPLWWAGFTPREWAESGKAPIELCALHWRREVDEIRAAIPYLESGSYIEVRYEDLTADPFGHMRRLIEFCDLPWSPRYEAALRKFRIDNRDYKWATQLSEREQEILAAALADRLELLGYPLQVASA